MSDEEEVKVLEQTRADRGRRDVLEDWRERTKKVSSTRAPKMTKEIRWAGSWDGPNDRTEFAQIEHEDDR